MNIRTVLIVDDDKIIREQMQKELQRNFYQPSIAENGETAIELFRNTEFDIVILDINLPDINGMEILKQMKQLRPHCEIIIVTGCGSHQAAIQSLRLGAIDYVEKPINSNELSTALGRAVEQLTDKKKLTFKNTLLVIDDDQTTIQHLRHHLENDDYTVLTAESGYDGLNIIEKNKIDIVITDIKVKDMDGIEILKKTKNLYDDIEVIVLTAHQEYAVRSLRAGAFDYLSKPITIEELLLSVKRAIERINFKRNSLYRNRELIISSEVMAKMNDELERRIEIRTKELNAVQAQLFQTSKLATLGEISAGLAHEMNQPLGGIALIAKHIRKLHERNRLSDDELLSGLDDIEISVKRMAKIIQHVRTFARQDILDFINVDINETIESGLSLLSEQLRLNDVVITKKLSSELPPIIGEPYQLEQVWVNLISNAKDAMNARQQIISETTGKPDDYQKKLCITSRWNPEKDGIEIIFIDNGMGIEDDVLEKIFNPFFTTKEVGKAIGLGLSISYGIIETHNGQIEVESHKEKGTTISIFLPAKGEY